VTDAKLLDEGLRGLVNLPRARPFAEPLSQMLGRPSVRVTTLKVDSITSPVVDARLSFTRGAQTPSSLRVAWTVDAGWLYLALGADVEPALVALVKSGADPQAQIGARAEVAALGRSLGNDAAVAALVDLSGLGLVSDRDASGALLAALGRSPSRAWLRVEIPSATVAPLTERLLVR
jgi:hypothetical protein